ncbi:MAG: response regulator [Myxococcales bacterium]|nr:response regulator [Myxococcales bacterium]
MPRRILVVDDHVELAENIAEILDGEGYTTAVAESAEAALACVPAARFDALITDYRLPGLSGADLISTLMQQGRSLPAVVMSAYTDPHTIALARSAGARLVLPKPVDIESLLTALRDILRTGADAAPLEAR